MPLTTFGYFLPHKFPVNALYVCVCVLLGFLSVVTVSSFYAPFAPLCYLCELSSILMPG